MNAPFAHPSAAAAPLAPPASPEASFAALCQTRARAVAAGSLMLCEAVDELQAFAELSGLIERIGQDGTQEIMGRALSMVDLFEDDEAFEREFYVRCAETLRRWELADSRDAWRHTGEAPPPAHVRNSTRPAQTPGYCTPEATINAFWYVVGLADPERFKAWLADHPRDAPFLVKLLEGK